MPEFEQRLEEKIDSPAKEWTLCEELTQILSEIIERHSKDKNDEILAC
jgi:hypothetical protein